MIASAGKDATIVLQGDHGSKLNLDQDSLARTDIQEVLPILFAVRAPFSDQVPADLTPVNLFRLIFSQTFGDDLPLLESKSFYSTWVRPYQYEQVSPTTKSELPR